MDGIAADPHALKLALFHTIFNTLGILLMLPLLRHLVRLLQRQTPNPLGTSRPGYLNADVDDFPETLESALRKEVLHLYDNAN